LILLREDPGSKSKCNPVYNTLFKLGKRILLTRTESFSQRFAGPCTTLVSWRAVEAETGKKRIDHNFLWSRNLRQIWLPWAFHRQIWVRNGLTEKPQKETVQLEAARVMVIW